MRAVRCFDPLAIPEYDAAACRRYAASSMYAPNGVTAAICIGRCSPVAQ